MPGLIQLGQNELQQANFAAKSAAELEAERNYQNQQIKAAGMQRMGQTAGMGAALGMSAGGPVGALIGAGIGAAVGRIF